MLDAYIIDRIRREREQEHRRGGRVPLHIDDRPAPPRKRDDDTAEDRPERGSVIIDYGLARGRGRRGAFDLPPAP